MPKSLQSLFLSAVLLSIAGFAYAEDPGAPVYDADSSVQQQGQPEEEQAPVFSDDNSVDASSSEESSRQSKQTVDASSSEDSSKQTIQLSAPPVQEHQTFLPKQTMSLEQRLRQAEQQINELQSSTSKVEQLQSDLQTLRGQLDDVTHQLQKAKQLEAEQQQKIQLLEKVSTGKPEEKLADKSVPDTINIKTPDNVPKTENSPAEPEANNQPTVAEEQQTYQSAYDLIKAKKYNDAIDILQKMLQKYPSGQFAANVHYWLGELYDSIGKKDQALTEYKTIVRNFPNSLKVDEAQLKLGQFYAKSAKWSDAKAAFKNVINNYPGTGSARIAQEQLKLLKKAGH